MIGLVPDWAPNIHPLIIHFPIALLITAVGMNLLMLLFKQIEWLKYTTAILYLLGAISTLTAYFTGRQAVDSVTLPPMANPVLSKHANLAWITLIYFTIIASTYLLIWWKSFQIRLWVLYVVFLAGIGGIFLLVKTGERGGELVFKYGVGTKVLMPAVESMDRVSDLEPTHNLVLNENGSWVWKSGENAAINLIEEFKWLEGDPNDVKITKFFKEQTELSITLKSEGTPILFVASEAIGSIQAEVSVNLDEFNGTFMIVHHVQDNLNYDFLSLGKSVMKLGRRQEGEVKILQEKPVKAESWVDLRVVGDGRHFRGYLGEDLVVHGHIQALRSGSAGLRISGDGELFIRQIRVTSLHENKD